MKWWIKLSKFGISIIEKKIHQGPSLSRFHSRTHLNTDWNDGLLTLDFISKRCCQLRGQQSCICLEGPDGVIVDVWNNLLNSIPSQVIIKWSSFMNQSALMRSSKPTYDIKNQIYAHHIIQIPHNSIQVVHKHLQQISLKLRSQGRTDLHLFCLYDLHFFQLHYQTRTQSIKSCQGSNSNT